jgi:hypothetical protein
MELKDYLHLYLGCDGELLSKKPYGSPKRTIIKLSAELLDRLEKLPSMHSFRPILRPLSDMTEVEATELEAIRGIDKKIPCPHFNNIHQTKHGEQLRYLLSKRFDLFGLIESGLAIDKTKEATHV